MDAQHYAFSAPLWKWSSDNSVAWYFITLPEEIAAQIRFFSSELKSAWGSIRVEVTIGQSTWKTSLFPNSGLGSYMLPVKAIIRKKEHLLEGDSVQITLRIT